MRVAVIHDTKPKTALAEALRKNIASTIKHMDHDIIELGVEISGLPSCTGCFRCATKHPGQCVFDKQYGALIGSIDGTDLVIYLSPVVFGTFSAAMKNVFDRVGMLARNTGSFLQVIIGFAEDAGHEEISTFRDIIVKHRGAADKVHPGEGDRYEVFFITREREMDSLNRSIKELL